MKEKYKIYENKLDEKREYLCLQFEKKVYQTWKNEIFISIKNEETWNETKKSRNNPYYLGVTSKKTVYLKTLPK